jgi:cytochrome c553
MRNTIRFLLATGVALFAIRALGSASDVQTQPMGGHMEVTLRSAASPGDRERANAIVAAARSVVAQYPTTADAERAGFQKFLPRVPLHIEHYTNRAYAAEAGRGHFDPLHPTSLIFERDGATLRIVGVMYTAPNRATQAQLNADVPMSVGTWHRHVNFCVPPPGTPRADSTGPNARFLFGSIATADECRAAHGWFVPRVLGWMIHVWPNETDPAKVWAVDHDGAMSDHDMGMMGGSPKRYDHLPIALDRLPDLAVGRGDPVAGQRVFALHCEECHGSGGRNGPDAPALADTNIAPGQVAYMVRHPRAIDADSQMPELPLTDAELADVAAYVASLSPKGASRP